MYWVAWLETLKNGFICLILHLYHSAPHIQLINTNPVVMELNNVTSGRKEKS